MANETDSCETNNSFVFWKDSLRGARYIVAPMVDQSELAWRILSRRYGAELCYTPMLHASVFIRDAHYRRESLTTCSEDRPLIVQFCANDPDTLLKAGREVEHLCEAVDINLGCPQTIAKRGHYGAFLQDEWDLLYKMVNLCARELSVPITCKVRIFEDIQRTVDYAKMLERAGAKLLTVHGRTREQKGPNTGIASWAHIKAVTESVKIPVFANGNIQFFEDIERCLKDTGAQGVMSAEGNLHNPALFSGLQPCSWKMAEEYLELVELYPCPMSFIRGHMFKLMHHLLIVHMEFRDLLGNCRSVEHLKQILGDIKKKCQPDVDAYELENKDLTAPTLPLPYWICQPYVRPDPSHTVLDEGRRLERENIKRLVDSINYSADQNLSRNKLKKLRRYCNKSFVPKVDKFVKCQNCGNPKGLKCIFDECKACCRHSVNKHNINCLGHSIFVKKKKLDESATVDDAENIFKSPYTSDVTVNCCETLQSNSSLDNSLNVDSR